MTIIMLAADCLRNDKEVSFPGYYSGQEYVLYRATTWYQ
jgi:hypothetical protein